MENIKQMHIYMRKISMVFFLLLVFIGESFAQKDSTILLHGHLVNGLGASCNEQILCINEHGGTLTLSNKNGFFSMHIHPADTILFKAYGYCEKAICFKDSAFKHSYKINVVLKKLIDTTGDTNLAAMYSFIVNDLYARFSRMDTSKYFVVQTDDIGEKSDALKKIFGHYINHHISKMNDDKFYGFIRFLLQMNGKRLLAESNRKLILGTKQYYYEYMHPPPGSNPEGSSGPCDGIQPKGKMGAFALVFLMYCIVGAMVQGGN